MENLFENACKPQSLRTRSVLHPAQPCVSRLKEVKNGTGDGGLLALRKKHHPSFLPPGRKKMGDTRLKKTARLEWVLYGVWFAKVT